MTVNKHGLSRRIPEVVAREVRQRDGFGCVLCGKAIFEYDHFDPPFADARTHSANGIVLLCLEHHGQKTRGILSTARVARAAEEPAARRQGFSHGPFDIGLDSPEIRLGTIALSRTPVLIRVLGEDILSVLPPEEQGSPFRISANLSDESGTPVLAIFENEWRSSVESWDVNVVGPRISIRRAAGDIQMILRTDAGVGLCFERLELKHKGLEISAAEGRSTTIRREDGGGVTAGAGRIDGCQVAIDLREQSLVVGSGGGSVRFGDPADLSQNLSKEEAFEKRFGYPYPFSLDRGRAG